MISFACIVVVDFSIRISDGEDFWGRVEIRRLGVWGQICVTGWDDAAANVTCRQLGQGFIGGHALGQSENSRLPIWVSSIYCLGNETSIVACTKSIWGEPADYGCKTAYVLCYKKSGLHCGFCHNFVSDLPNHFSLWFLHQTPTYIIKTRERKNTHTHTHKQKQAKKKKKKKKKSIKNNAERHGLLSNKSYLLSSSIGVSYEIVDSTFPGQGRLQLTFEGVPGSVGTEEWSDNDAHIACRQMGYASGVTAEPTSAGIQPFYLNKLICYSEEIKSVLQCGNTGWGMNATGLTESASVKCYKHGRSLNVLFKISINRKLW